jgi:hypothetical protein
MPWRFERAERMSRSFWPPGGCQKGYWGCEGGGYTTAHAEEALEAGDYPSGNCITESARFPEVN